MPKVSVADYFGGVVVPVPEVPSVVAGGVVSGVVAGVGAV